MPHDLVIRHGTLVDGTGAPARAADVAVDGGRITAIGDLDGAEARRELDATGLTVTPGFVDLHTHLDAQVAWDPYLTSSSWHGVTTVLTGNCGVTFAPVAPENRAYLAEMMESVEDIPRDAILGGLPWDWETFPEYLDSVERMRPALNVAALVGHCAARYHVLGDRALGDEPPTADELAQLADIAAASVAGGAVGYSTSRLLGHRVPDGRCVPGTFSPVEEYVAIAEGMNRAGGGVFQAVLDFDTKAGHEFGLLRTMAEVGGDVLFSGGVGQKLGPEATQRTIELWDGFLRDTRAAAGRITTVSMTRPSGFLMSLHQVAPVRSRTWSELLALPTLEERLARLRDASSRAELVADGERKGLWYDPAWVFPLGLGEVPDFHLDGRGSLAELAAAAGVHPIEVVIDQLLESEGRALFNVWIFNRNVEALDAFLQLEGTCPGLADSGAHAGQICDADAPTHYLAQWWRDAGRVSFEHAVHQLTAKPAAVLGLVDRGTVAVGNHADLNVLDPARLQVGYPEYAEDFPNGAGRLRVRATGYAATLVNGVTVTEHGQTTGERPGRVLREFRRG